MNRETLAWAAGFFDGEGCMSISFSTKARNTPRTNIGQKEPELLERFRDSTGIPASSLKLVVNGRKFPCWYLNYYGFEKSQALIAQLWPWLGPYKRSQAKRVLRGYINPWLEGATWGRANREKTHCPKGHEYTPENTSTYKTGKSYTSRRCKTCRRAQERARNASEDKG